MSLEIICEQKIESSLNKQFKTEIKKSIEFVKKENNRDYDWICLCFVNEDKIEHLNENFLKHEGATDVLSFPYHEENQKIQGDVICCYSYIASYYSENLHQKNEKNLSWYFYETILHGILHLFGLQHDYTKESLQKVHQKQFQILNQINIQWEIIDEFISTME